VARSNRVGIDRNCQRPGEVADWPSTSFAARQQYVCNRGQSGSLWLALETTLMTQSRHQAVCHDVPPATHPVQLCVADGCS